MVRRWAALAVVGFAGCESLRNPPPPPTPTPDVQPAPAPPPFVAAPQTEDVTPVAATQPPAPAADSLTLAAECLERGERDKAADHMQAYVRANPEQLMFRAQLAELLVRVGRDDAARVHFERFADDARRATGAPRGHLVHTHTRLMEIAQRSGDRGAELFHRGAGLLLLVKEQDGAADRDGGFCEEMLCKAMKSLAEAKEINPDDARVRFLLAEVYERAGNRRAADAERVAARSSVVPSGLGPQLR